MVVEIVALKAYHIKTLILHPVVGGIYAPVLSKCQTPK